MRLDCPPRCQAKLKDPTIPLWIAEGERKADVLAFADLCAIALPGVWNLKGRNTPGDTVLLADFGCVALDGPDVRIVFDFDAMTKPDSEASEGHAQVEGACAASSCGWKGEEKGICRTQAEGTRGQRALGICFRSTQRICGPCQGCSEAL